MCLRNISLCEEHNAVFTGFSNLNNNVSRFFCVLYFFCYSCARPIFTDEITFQNFFYFISLWFLYCV